ncbi:DNRLRE domain-containing protein [Kitasatospora sp. NPDC051853]|uniref:DNRLRE domain-containing protein n=1 Tax=Kitasatospora sp. NPDC051853 TaxID=3364058 RepID=UPI0037A1DE5E
MRRVRRIAVLAALGLVVETGVALGALTPASTAAAEPKPPVASPVNEAPDEASALLAARLNKRRIEVTGARTENTTLWANPEGTLTQEVAGGPVRMKVGEAWVPVDTTLVETADGAVAPKAHPEGLKFSGGDAAVQIGDALPGTTPAAPANVPSAAASPSASASVSATAKETAPLSASPSATASATATPGATASATAQQHAARSALRAAAPAADPKTPAAPAERDLVKVGNGEAQVELGWLGKLPKPKLSGNKATYVNARPGVDLVLEATRTGFEQFLVVKDRNAVSQAGTLNLPLDTTGYAVEKQDDGSIHLVDHVGHKPTVKVPAPVMWDAAVDEKSGEHLNRGAVSMELRGQGADAELVFTADAAFLTDPKTQYPVTIDPTVDLGTNFDTFVQKGTTTDQSSSTDLKVGTYDGGTTVARSFLHFPTYGFRGKQILGATLNLYNYHSFSCTAKEWEVWNTNYASTGTRWTAQPAWGQEYAWSFDTRDTDTGDAYQCANGDGSGWVKADVKNLAAAWAANSNDYNALGLKADNESDSYAWKRFYSSEGAYPPYLSVTYNSVPPTPSSMDVLPSVPGNPAYTSSATPRFQVLAADADGGNVGVNVDLWKGSTFVNGIYRTVPAGTYLQVTPADLGVAKLDEDTTYSIWGRVSDANAQSGWVGTAFVVDTVKPGAPFVTSPTYPADGLWHGGAGQAGQFTFTPVAGQTDLIGFVYTLDGGAPVTVAANQTITTSITPATDGKHTLKVQAKDRAGNLSDATSFAFQVGRAGLTSPVDGSQSAKRVKLSVEAQADLKRVVYQYRRGPGATEYNVPLANLTKADNTPVTDPKPRLADLGTHANWTVVDTLGNVGGVVQVRALMFPEDGSGAGVATGWNTMTVDQNADGAASSEVGPGSVNLLTGDYSTDVTDADEFGMSVKRTFSSRGLGRGWETQGERLTANQRQVSTDTTGFTAGQATVERSTVRGHDNSTDSLRVVPAASGWDSFAAVGPEYTLGQGMKPGKTYRLSAWIYVPSATGLDTSALPHRGLRIVGVYKNAGTYGETASSKASFTDGWQQLTLDMVVPKDATEAWFRLYNGNVGGSGKEVFFDDISLKEIVAPFGPQWAGGPDAGTGSEYRSLSFPESDLVEIKHTDDSVTTFAKGTDGTFFPEPGAESLTLTASPAPAGALVTSFGQCLEVPNGAPANGVNLQYATCTGAPNQQWTYGADLSLKIMGYCLDNPWGATADNTRMVLWTCGSGSPNQQWRLQANKSLVNGQSGKCLDANLGGTIWTCWGGSWQIWDLQTNGTAYKLSELDGSYTLFSRQAGSEVYQVTTETGPDAASTTRYSYDTTDGRSLPKRVIAPVEPGVDDLNGCTLNPLPRGCEVMDYDYPVVTTAVAGTPGDYVDRVRSVKVWSWNPATSQQEAVEVAHYAYDEQGRLAQVWDPRLATPLKTSYTYDAAGRVTKLSPVGELPWNVDYGQAVGDPDAGRLLKVRRGTLATGSKDVVNGEIATKVVYGVPLTRGAGGPYDMAGADVAKWAQTDAPTDATAVFGPEDEPGTHSASATTPGQDGYKPATVHYLNASGQEVNTATPSVTSDGDIDTSEYDRFGHVVRSLEATNRSIALGKHPDTTRFEAELGLPTASADRARLLDSRTTYTLDGQDVAETLGPLYRATLAETMAGQTNPVVVTAEAETLPQLGANYPLKMDADCCGLTWSGGAQLSLRGTAAGAEDTVRVSVPEEGDYVLSGQLTRYNDHGIVQLSIDGTNLGSPIDEYSATPAVAPFTTGAPIHLARGDHSLKMLVTGTNAASTGERFHAGFDTFTLTKTTVNPTILAGTSVLVRDHNTNTYDEGKPDGQAYHLVTTSTDGARIEGYAADAELRVTKNGYGTPIGGTSGWVLKTPTSVTTDAAGQALTATIKYDASGHALESRKPGSAGADASTVKTVFYTAGANADDVACGNRPEWAGNPCTTGPGGAIVGADSARMPTTLPVKRITRYSRFGDAEETTETNAGKTRKAVTVFDGADRILSTEITSDEGKALPAVTTEYDQATGDIVKTYSGKGTAAEKSITRNQDALGRLISYTDADGGTTTTEFDKFGKPTKVSDPTGFTTYTYDRTKEPRGLVTSVNDSLAGEFTATYGPDGQLVEQSYPGGIVRKDSFNAVGSATGRSYTRASDGAVVWSQSIELSTQGAVAKDTSSAATRAYTYDRLGRLTKAEQTTVAAGCVTRQYSFDGHSNRTSKLTSPTSATGCSTDNAVAENHTYDSADRITDQGFGYDAFGRTVTTSTGATNTYWANDKVASQVKGDDKQEWAVDIAHRLTAFTTSKKQADGSWANATSKLNHYGDDSDEVRWVIEDTTQGTLTRNVSGPDADLSATTSKTGDVRLQLTNLQGSVVVTTDTALTTPVVLDFDEFGIPQDGQAKVRYGWLGGKQRSAEALDGDILMGARLYSPALGRFLQVDPQPGGNASPYDYCSGDPVNCTDLDGNWGFSFKKVLNVVAKVAEVASYIPGPIGGIAAAVSSVSYAATGNWAKAAEMAVTAAASLVGANTAVKAGFTAVKATRAATRVGRAASVARNAYRATVRSVRNAVRRSGCNSFDQQTPVLMADGSYVAIGDIEVGDLVSATDPVTGRTTAEPVVAVFTTYATKHMVDISTDADGQTPGLRATAYHPIWVDGKGWTEAENIRPGDHLIAANGRRSEVVTVVDEGEVAEQLVINLNVGNVHTFTVSDGAGGDIVTHNSTEVCPIHGAVKRPWKLTSRRSTGRVERQGGHTYHEQKPDRNGDVFWWSADTAGHAKIRFKVMRKVKKEFVHHKDACVCGTYADKKHKGKKGKVVRRR